MPPRTLRTMGEGTALAGVAAALCLSGTAHAQQTSDEIVVTAQRRETTIEQTPAAITALSAVQLEQRGIDDLSQLQFATPSVTFGKNLGAVNVAIRGVGRDVGIPAVSINIDGVYQPNSATQEAALIDLQRVEVLRGPQGTLYGRNANAGVVNFVTTSPTDEFEGWARAGYASFNEFTIRGVLNTPFSPRAKARFGLSYNDREDGFIENIAGGPDMDKGQTLSGRARLALDVSDTFKLDFAINGFRREGAFDYIVYNSAFGASVVASNPVLGATIVPSKPWRTSSSGPSDSEREALSTSMTATWALPFATLRSVTAYQTLDVEWQDDRDGTNPRFVEGLQEEHSDTFTQELTVSGKTSAADWVGGVFYLADRGDSRLLVTLPSGLASFGLAPGGSIERNTTRQDTDAYGVFADTTLNITDSFRLIGGLRYSEDHVNTTNTRRVTFVPNLATVSLCANNPTSLSFSSTTYRAGAQYDVGEAQNIYGTVSSGFKSGGVNLNDCTDTYEPETITSYEIGYKARAFDGAVSLRTAAFYYDYKDFQVVQVVGLATAITNAAGAEVKGFEAELDWRPDDHWTLNASLSLLNATYSEFTNLDTLNPAAGFQNLSGNHLNNAPETSGSLGAAYRTTMTSAGAWTFRLDAASRSRVYFREFNTAADTQGAYSVLNANIVWESPDDKFTARLFANNLTNQDYRTSLIATDALGARGGTFGDPRQIGVEIGARF